MKLVIDHLRGARRGQRQVIESPERVSFGRHPSNMVAFDAQSDIDASSRHAELVLVAGSDTAEGGYVLRDIGSSNGTWVAGDKIQERALGVREPVEVEFGSGGPILRLWLGLDADLVPVVPAVRRGWRRLLPW